MPRINEAEPNNIESQVHDLGPLSPQDPIILSGQLNSADDTQDWFYIHPTVSGNITAVYSSDRGEQDTVTKYFDASASEKMPYNTMLEKDDEGIFNYQTELTLDPVPTAGPLPAPPPPDVPLPEPPLPSSTPMPGPMPEPPPPGPVILDHVPAYDQGLDFFDSANLGCIPIAIASVLGYWDQKGYGNLFKADSWDKLKLTGEVAEEISSTTHRDTYDPRVLKEEGPSRGTSIADFAQTSVSSDPDGSGPILLEPMEAGFGWARYIPDAVSGYADLPGKDYNFSCLWHDVNPTSSEAAWDILTEEIDAKHPLLAGVDSGIDPEKIFGRTFDGKPDHYVPVVGYHERPDGHYYGFYDNWGEEEKDIVWAKFEPNAQGVEWGVNELYTIQPAQPGLVDSPPDFASLDLTLIA